MLAKIAHFRKDGRYPTAVYLEKTSGCAIYRSSEPLPDLNLRGCSEDLEYFHEMSNMPATNLKGWPKIYVYTGRLETQHEKHGYENT